VANLSDTYYAAEGGFHGYGAQLKMGDGTSPENFEAVAEVKRIVFGDMTTAVLDRTHLRSPAAHREKLLALRDSGPFTVECNYRPDHESQTQAGGGSGSFTAGGLLYVWINRLTKNYVITLPYGSPEIELPFTGGITKYQPGEVGPDGMVSLSLEITPLTDFSASLP
jgi:hypothetical protein